MIGIFQSQKRKVVTMENQLPICLVELSSGALQF